MKKKLQNNLIILSITTLIIVGVVLVTINALNKNETKVFTANKINQKTSEVPQNREIVNIPDKVFKDYLLDAFKSKGHGYFKFINDEKYVKPENETEIYKDEMEKVKYFYYGNKNYLGLSGLESATNLESFEMYIYAPNYVNYKVENLEILKKFKKLKKVELFHVDLEDYTIFNKLKNLEELKLLSCGIPINHIKELEELKNKGKKLDVRGNWLILIPEKNKFNIPEVIDENGKKFDFVKEYDNYYENFEEHNKGKIKKNIDGTYSFTKKEELGIVIFLGDKKKVGNFNLDEFDNLALSIHIYLPKSNYKETETITKTVKDKSENILNTENEKKLKAVLKRNGKIIDVKPITNIGHRKNAKQLIEFKFNNLRVYEDAKENEVLKEYNYEVEITGEDLSEGYKLEKNNKSDGNDGDYVVTYISPKIDATFKLVYQGIGGDDEKPKVNIRLTRNGVAFGDVVTINGEYEYIFKGIDKTDEKEKPYKYGVEVVGEVTGYDATISADGNTVILTKKIEKGKILPYAGPKTNILFGIALVVIIGYAVKVFSNQRRMNNIKKIKGIKR